MKYLLVTLLLFSSLWASAKTTASPVDSLEQTRLELASSLTADQQPVKFDKALLALCDSFKSEVATAAHPSADYLKQMLLLADRLLEIDPGKNAMDCFGPYYSKNRAKVNVQLKSMDSALQDRLQHELELAYNASNRADN